MKKLHAKYFLMYFLFLSSLLSVLGCSDEDYGASVPAGSRELVLSYQQQVGVDVITRGVQSEEEYKINNLYSIFYKYDTDESKRTFAGVSVTALNSDVEEGKAIIKMPVGLSALDKYDVYFLANPEGYVWLYDEVLGGFYENVKVWLETKLSDTTYSEAAGLVEGTAPSAPISPAPGFPMFGTATKEGNTDAMEAVFTRAVSRIDLSIDQSVLPHKDFELESVKIYNARNYTKLLSGSSVDLSDNSFTNHSSYAFIPETKGHVDQIEGKMYTFPNHQPVSSKGDRVTTCLIIKGKYNKGESSYYRLNVKPTIGSQDLKPNHLYKIRITGVTGSGFIDEESAYREGVSGLIYEIDDWSPGDMDGSSSDAYGNKLDVSPRRIVFSHQDNQTVNVNILKKLKDPDDPDHNPGGVTVTSSDPTNFEAILANPNATEFEIKALNVNYGNADREAYVMVKWGTIQVPVYITQLGATSISGGMRVSPSEMNFNGDAQERAAVLLVSGDQLSGVDVDQITGKVFNTSEGEREGWCKIKNNEFRKTDMQGVFEFDIAVEKMPGNTGDSRSALAHFTLKKDNGDVLNAVLFISQTIGGGTRVVSEFLYYRDDFPPVNQSPTNDVGYRVGGSDLWSFKTAIEGVPDEFNNLDGSRHLLFGITTNRILKYRLRIDPTKEWEIELKGSAADIGALEVSAASSEELKNPNDWVYIVAGRDVERPWTDGRVVIKFTGESDETFWVHQLGLFSYLKGSTESLKNGKIFYYGTIKVLDMTMLDRNLGASGNGYYANYDESGAGKGQYTTDVKNRGTYFEKAEEAAAACPPKWRLPKKEGSTREWGELFNRAEYGTVVVNGLTYNNVWYAQLNDNPPFEYWLIPLCGSGGDGKSTGMYGGFGYYWSDNRNFTVFQLNPLTGAPIKSWRTSEGSNGFSARCVRYQV